MFVEMFVDRQRGGRRIIPMAVATALAALSLAGCSMVGGARGGSDGPGVQLPPSAAPGPQGDAQRTSISSASQQDVAATLRANGVDDPQHWASIVVQHQPYPPGEPGMGKLRQVLAQYRADPPTTGKIMNALRP
jgi:hypothetical protein